LHFRAEAPQQIARPLGAKKLARPTRRRKPTPTNSSAGDRPNASDLVVARVLKDFAAGVDQSEHQIRRTMDELLITANAEIKSARNSVGLPRERCLCYAMA